MSTSLSPWLKDALTRTPGAVRAVVRSELINAAREFYRNSTAWRELMENAFLAVDDFSVQVVSSLYAEAEVLQIYAVEVNNIPIELKAERPVGDRSTGTPTAWYPTAAADTIEVWPTPDQYDDDLRVRAILIPTVGATTLPDVALLRHYDGLLDGLLARLYAHPAKPYSNVQGAQYHLSRFRNAIGVAKGEVIQGGAAGQNWQFPRFGK